MIDGGFTDYVLGFSLLIPRISGAFLILPLLTTSTVPALVRNSLMVGLAIAAVPLVGETLPESHRDLMLASLVLKELFIGVAIGFLFSGVFWALGMAGNLIDTRVGTNIASIIDPIGGHETSLTGTLLTRLGAWLFMASGAFLIFIDVLLGSFVLWPVGSFFPNLPEVGIAVLADYFGLFMTLALMIAAPALIVLTLVDVGFGLINRLAPELNVFILSLPLKAWLATLILIMVLGAAVEVVLRYLISQQGLLELLQDIL
ncbi:MAG: type III secretion system export apparatus subunit SctT [Wenzhouxiangella sp.]